MQSTRSASMMFLRRSPSPDWSDESEPSLAMTKPAVPLGPGGKGSVESRRSWRLRGGQKLPFPHTAATCDICAYEHQSPRALFTPLPAGSISAGAGLQTVPRPQRIWAAVSKRRFGQAVTVTKRRFSDRPLMASGHRHQTGHSWPAVTVTKPATHGQRSPSPNGVFRTGPLTASGHRHQTAFFRPGSHGRRSPSTNTARRV